MYAYRRYLIIIITVSEVNVCYLLIVIISDILFYNNWTSLGKCCYQSVMYEIVPFP